MRYYDLRIATGAASDNPGQVLTLDATSGRLNLVAPGAGVTSFTSHVRTPTGLQYNPGALNVEFDLPVAPQGAPQGKQFIRVWGVGLKAISQAFDLSGYDFTLTAGMQYGIAGRYGLANPKQVNTISQGSVYQGFGNWQGVNQTLELIVTPGLNDNSDSLLSATLPNGITINWQPGQPLQPALAAALSAALPNYTQVFAISQSLAPLNNAPYQDSQPTLVAFAANLEEHTQKAGVAAGLGATYPGVQLAILGSTVQAYDYTEPQEPVLLNFQDLIGQPTWIAFQKVSFKTVLRGDITYNTPVSFPQGTVVPYAITAANAAVPGAPVSSQLQFKGTFQITDIHYYANFRQADADSWCTVYEAIPNQ